ncbi:hypothetical protein GH714_033902 [Hevea brasiliensis]|uniref:Reverse transcriptase Ty1/copia-type domain-containing protein n=1 Tax=Hevea brasiliensis TaxID=3981 RepID=A0A6A6NE81_HEVBR|nr:hypothetical protein GH714_033902 [Hevea brasiliensis]
MNKSKPLIVSFTAHFKLSIDISPKIDEKIEHMSSIPYSSTVGSIMYAIVCTQPNILYTVSVVSRYMSRPRKEHWQAMKWILRYLKGAPFSVYFVKIDKEELSGVVLGIGSRCRGLGEQVNAAFGSSWKEVLSEGQLVEGEIHPGSPTVLITGTFASRAIELLRSSSSSFFLD